MDLHGPTVLITLGASTAPLTLISLHFENFSSQSRKIDSVPVSLLLSWDSLVLARAIPDCA